MPRRVGAKGFPLPFMPDDGGGFGNARLLCFCAEPPEVHEVSLPAWAQYSASIGLRSILLVSQGPVRGPRRHYERLGGTGGCAQPEKFNYRLTIFQQNILSKSAQV